jgi:hypothetical protein
MVEDMETSIHKSKRAWKWFGLWPSDYSEEEVMTHYENTMEALEDVAEKYGRELEHEGLAYGQNLKFGSEVAERAKSSIEAPERDDIRLLGNSDNHFEADPARFATTDGVVRGAFKYKPSYFARGAKGGGWVSVTITPDERIGDEEAEDLRRTVEEALEQD